MKKIVFAAIIATVCYLKVSSQSLNIKHSGTAAVFITTFKPSLYLGYTYQPKKVSFSVRILGFADERKAGKDNDLPIQKYLDYALLAGIPVINHKHFHVSSYAGISYINAIKRGNFINEQYGWTGTRYRYFEEKKTSTIGLPVEIKTLFLINEDLGITAIGYTNLNSKISTAGYGLGVFFGF